MLIAAVPFLFTGIATVMELAVILITRNDIAAPGYKSEGVLVKTTPFNLDRYEKIQEGDLLTGQPPSADYEEKVFILFQDKASGIFYKLPQEFRHNSSDLKKFEVFKPGAYKFLWVKVKDVPSQTVPPTEQPKSNRVVIEANFEIKEIDVKITAK